MRVFLTLVIIAIIPFLLVGAFGADEVVSYIVSMELSSEAVWGIVCVSVVAIIWPSLS